MSLDKFEIWVHDHILKNTIVRHFLYGLYQRVLYVLSPKIKYEGNLKFITPQDGYEYLFGYYDKCPWDSTGQYILALRVKSATQKADSTEKAEIIRIDLKDDNSAEVLTTTHSWNVQQGCMAQWLDDNTVIYNDFREGRFCSVLLNIESKAERLLALPIYTLSADKKTALTLDFTRLHRLRPGYGYANVQESTRNEKCPDSPCIWKVDIETNEIIPILRYTDFARFEPREEMHGAEHKVNHLMLSPDGKRFMVLHRWFKDSVKYTRLVTCNIDGTDMYNLSDDGFVSHCCWKNDKEILSYLNKHDGGKGYYLMTDKTHSYTKMWPELAMDGHPTYSPNGEFVVTDTYPNRKRFQSIYTIKGGNIECVARVFSPFKYSGDVRCDLHPRWSADSKQICFDASFCGKRSVCIVDAGKLKSECNVADNKGHIPTISVIIPCYNCADMVGETLQSLEEQTYKNFEIICVNDGSKDNTLQVLQEWQFKGSLNINIIDQTNGGVSRARNNGIDNAKGEYILFLDSDDIFHREYISSLVDATMKAGADTAYCRVSRNLAEVRQYLTKDGEYVVHTQKEAMDKLLFEMGKYGFYSYLYKNQRLNELLLRFDENTKFGEDREFNWKYLCHCKIIAWVDMPLYGYRVNLSSATQRSASWRKTDLLAAVKRIEDYLTEHGCAYSDTFNDYMYSRAMWAVAKTFAASKDQNLYIRLRKEYDVRRCMRRTARDSNKLVAVASVLYLIHPILFFKALGLKSH